MTEDVSPDVIGSFAYNRAVAFYGVYENERSLIEGRPPVPWRDLSRADKAGWFSVAQAARDSRGLTGQEIVRGAIFPQRVGVALSGMVA